MPISTLLNDGMLDIATGRDRNTKTWKNKQVNWSELLTKLSDTHRTAEKYSDYLTAKKSRQDEIKDIGGFVGGYLANGRRKTGSIVHRQLITLDADFASLEFWDDFTMLFNCAACIYTTHKHSSAHPRFRLVIPLDREVMSDEYIPIARKIADSIGINDFDPTGFRPTQLMYWPSTAKDGEYVFQYQDGAWLSADSILNSYHNWRDASEWPMSDREKEIPLSAIKKQGDPLEKQGLIGAFCRAYTITEAIEVFLPDVYEECDTEGRYTFRQGSTAGGLVIYEDKYAYSHHGTDPVSGKLCNAFDLVRLHKYGLKDEDAREGTPGNRLPSFTEMTSFVAADTKVIKQIGSDRLTSAQEDFADEVIENAINDEEWKGEMDVDKKGNYLSTIKNIVLVLKNDPRLKGRLFMNEFEGRLIVTKNLPWRLVTPQTSDFTDDDADCLAEYLEGFEIPFTNIPKALSSIRNAFKIHPVREYLKSLTWDGVERLDSLFIDYLGAEDSEYVRAVCRKTFVAAVARVFNPGVKFDTVTTFVGEEGIGKSTLIAKMGKQWFSDCLGDIHDKSGMESLRGVWIMEIAELSAFNKADQDAIRRFITSLVDIYRPSYGKQLVRYPRQCIFVASTNTLDFLKSGQRNRRFWPVLTHVQPPSKDIFSDLTEREMGLIWAEACKRFEEGELLTLPDNLYIYAQEKREEHTEVDDRSGMISEYLAKKLPENWSKMGLYDRRAYLSEQDELQPAGTEERTAVCVAEIWCEALGHMAKDMNRINTKFIHDYMRSLKGWKHLNRTKRLPIYGPQKMFEKVVTRHVTRKE